MDLNFSYDERTDSITIEGVKYHGDLFRKLGIAPVGSLIEIVAREDGVLTLKLHG
jgi:hypothetical protein